MSEATLFDGKSATGTIVLPALNGRFLTLYDREGGILAEWTLDRLVRTNLDAPDDEAVFRHGTGPERLSLPDGLLLWQLREAGARTGRTRRWTAQIWASVLLGILAALAVAALLADQIPALAVPFVPPRLERGWSSAIQATLAGTAARCRGQAGQAALDRLVGRLAKAASLPRTPSAAVLNSELVNAFTLPDGRILVLRGLIDRAGNPDELAGVLAHELGHAKHRDPTREMLRRLALDMLARSLGWGGDIAGEMTALSYSRRAEAAADASAMETLSAAGLHTGGLAGFFTHINTATGADPLPAFLSDHPSTAARAASLRGTPGGETALDPAAWSALRGICGTR